MKAHSTNTHPVGSKPADVFMITLVVTFWGALIFYRQGGVSALFITWVAAGCIGMLSTIPVWPTSPPKRVEPGTARQAPSKNLILFSVEELLSFPLLSALLMGILHQHTVMVEVAIGGLAFLKIFGSLRSRRQRNRLLGFYGKIYFGSGWRPYGLAVGTLVLTLVVAGVLMQYGPSVLRVSLLDTSANVTMLPLKQAHQAGGWQGSLLILIPLLLLLPSFALQEERFFRKGRIGGRAMVQGAVIFGLVHGIVGIPLFAAMALIGAGFCFSLYYRSQYRKLLLGTGSTHRATLLALWPATTMHTLYNSIVVLTGYLFLLIN